MFSGRGAEREVGREGKARTGERELMRRTGGIEIGVLDALETAGKRSGTMYIKFVFESGSHSTLFQVSRRGGLETCHPQ